MLSEKNDFQQQKLWKRLQRVAAAPGGRTRLDLGEHKQQPQGQTGERGFPWTEVLVPPKDYEGSGEEQDDFHPAATGHKKMENAVFFSETQGTVGKGRGEVCRY